MPFPPAILNFGRSATLIAARELVGPLRDSWGRKHKEEQMDDQQVSGSESSSIMYDAGAKLNIGAGADRESNSSEVAPAGSGAPFADRSPARLSAPREPSVLLSPVRVVSSSLERQQVNFTRKISARNV